MNDCEGRTEILVGIAGGRPTVVIGGLHVVTGIVLWPFVEDLDCDLPDLFVWSLPGGGA